MTSPDDTLRKDTETLQALFHERQDAFVRRIDEAADLEEATSSLKDELLSLNKTFAARLAPREARLVGFIFDALREFSQFIITVEGIVVPVAEAPTDTRNLLLNSIAIAIAATLFISLLPVAAVPALLSLGLIFLIGRGLFAELRTFPMPPGVRWLLRKLKIRLDTTGTASSALPQEVRLRANGVAVARYVGNALDIVDRALRDLTDSAKTDADHRTILETVPDVLDFFQDLMGDALSKDAALTLRRTQQLPQILHACGLRLESYDPSATTSTNHFMFEPSIDPNTTHHTTLKPALLTVEESRLVRPGRVIEPTET